MENFQTQKAKTGNDVMVTSPENDKRFRSGIGEDFSAPAAKADANPGVAEVTVTSRRDAKISSVYSWEPERIRVLVQIFEGVERKAANGKTVASALRSAARRWKGKTYRAKPGKPFAFSFKTLGRLFYAWRKTGRVASALTLHYKPGTETKVAPEFGTLLTGLCLETDALSFAEAIRAIGQAGLVQGNAPSTSTFLRKVPAPVRRELRDVFKKRFELRRAERRARRVCATKGSRK